jgi:hypothetical protein
MWPRCKVQLIGSKMLGLTTWQPGQLKRANHALWSTTLSHGSCVRTHITLHRGRPSPSMKLSYMLLCYTVTLSGHTPMRSPGPTLMGTSTLCAGTTRSVRANTSGMVDNAVHMFNQCGTDLEWKPSHTASKQRRWNSGPCLHGSATRSSCWNL